MNRENVIFLTIASWSLAFGSLVGVIILAILQREIPQVLIATLFTGVGGGVGVPINLPHND